jgi:hypothetical protein
LGRELALRLALAVRLRAPLLCDPLPFDPLLACLPLLLDERLDALDVFLAALDPFEDARARLLARLDDPRALVAAISHLSH